MNPEYVVQKKYEAFVDGTKRFRWFILITILLSSLQLAHLYIENGFTRSQILRVVKRQVMGELHLDKQLYNKLLSEIKDPKGLTKEEVEKRISEAAEYKMSFQMGDNLVADAKVGDRTIPLLQFAVPGNDFVFVLGFMLAIFCVAVWLSSRSVLASVTSLQPHANLPIRELIRLNFLFTGSLSSDWIGRAIQYLAIWSSFLCFGIAIFLDFFPLYQANDPELRILTKIHLILALSFFTIIGIFSIMTTIISWKIDSLIEGALPNTP